MRAVSTRSRRQKAQWRIYYSDRVVEGNTEQEWRSAPDSDVQVVVLYETPRRVRWSYSGGPVRDRQLWTGQDVYDPFDWGEKYGRLLSDEEYFNIWERACGDDPA